LKVFLPTSSQPLATSRVHRESVDSARGERHDIFMKKLNLQTEIGPGQDTEINLLFDGMRRKIMQITLRRSAVLKAHQAVESITVQCVAGAGEFLDVSRNEIYKLLPGVLITVEPEIVHEVRALPDVSILLTKFKGE
jgi:quercetin dioxygenase-like cupin family protein